jgi:NADPH2:quinone reductase
MKKAACLFINPLTAFCFIDIMKKNNHKSVIHTAGASAVGRIFTRLCVKHNLRLINTVRKEKYLDELKKIGGSTTFNITTSKESYKQELLLAKEEFKPKIAFENIGGDMTGNILNAIEHEGVLYHYGNLSLRNISNVSTYDVLFADKSIKGFWLFKYLNEKLFNEFEVSLKNEPEIYDTNIQSVFNPEDYEEAFKTYRINMSKGKILFDFN